MFITDFARKDHVVQFIDFRRDPTPLFVMEYLPLGNLQDQNTSSPIAVEEWSTLLYQCLTALSYLHSHNITHRDLKPENILLHSRTPLWVRVGDLGLAKKGEDLRTRCGNYRDSPRRLIQIDLTQAAWIFGTFVLL